MIIKTAKRSIRPQQDADITQIICAFLDEQKAEDIVCYDLSKKSALADHMIIATGLSQRHISALSEKLKEFLHHQGVREVLLEGYPNSDWILVDGGNAVIHLFKPDMRDYYGLDKMWGTSFGEDHS